MLDKMEISRVLAITVDNASANDVAVRGLKRKLLRNDSLIGDGEHFHVRCAAHIVNLIVKDGLEEVKDSIVCIRNVVKYVGSSPSRLEEFKKSCEAVKLTGNSSMCLDCPTRWNSTFIMLKQALKHKKAIEHMEESNPHFQVDRPPTHEDWENSRVLCEFLEHFYDVTVELSGTSYVTANQYFHDVDRIQGILNDYMNVGDPRLYDMCVRMKEKFDKYWGSIDKMNMLLIIGLVLDPRYKLKYVEYCYSRYLEPYEVKEIVKKVKDALLGLFNTYKAFGYQPSSMEQSSERTSQAVEAKKMSYGKKKESFLRWAYEQESAELRTEIDRYLEEKLEQDTIDFDILSWWGTSSYRTLSLVAKDVMAIPVSTVASESAFSTGGRVLDQYRSSLTPTLVESLICSQDWLRALPKDVEEEDKIVEVAKVEQGK